MRSNFKFPRHLLGWSYKKWSTRELRLCLEAWGYGYSEEASKAELYEYLYTVSQAQGLTTQDRATVVVKRSTSQHQQHSAQRSSGEGDTQNSGLGNEGPDSPQDIEMTDCPPYEIELGNENSETSIPSYSTTLHASSAGIPKCLVCFEGLNNSNSPSRKITNSCNHSADICLDCLSSSITAQAQSKPLDELNCPICQSRLDHDAMHDFTPQELFHRWEMVHIRKAMPIDYTLLYCGFDDCNNSGYYHPDMGNWLTCSVCQRITCAPCRSPYHYGLSCEEHQTRLERSREANEYERARKAERAEEERLTAEQLDRLGHKNCPRCGARTEKDRGCDHMSKFNLQFALFKTHFDYFLPACLCGHQYCWVCGYSRPFMSRAYHAPTCTHYRAGYF